MNIVLRFLAQFPSVPAPKRKSGPRRTTRLDDNILRVYESTMIFVLNISKKYVASSFRAEDITKKHLGTF